MQRSIIIGTFIIVLGFVLNISAKANERFIKSDRIIVTLKDGAKLPSFKGVKSSKYFFGNIHILNTTGSLDLIDSIRDHSSVESAKFDTFAAREKLPQPVAVEKLDEVSSLESTTSGFNDPGLRRLWAFRDGQSHGMSVSKSYTTFGKVDNTAPIIVAVVDTGVDYNHEDLKDVMWVNEGEIAGNGIDDDGNGYIDDIHGINTLKRDAQGRATGDMSDTHSHGTHVSGTIAATQNNGKGIAGVASNVRIMGIRTVPNSGDETDVDVAESYLYAAKNGARIINCSFGKSHNEGGTLVKDTIDHIAETYNVLVVTSAGNSSQDIDRRLTYPASFDSEGMIVIASSTNRGRLSYFSNYGRVNVDVAAPGSSIYSTTPGNRYGNMSGTSMASPNLSGVAAEILSHNPSLTAYELKETLMNNVNKKSSMEGDFQSEGVVDLYQAISNL